jgi:hypothetical protein
MSAFMWNANPEKWDAVPPSSSRWDALRDYVLDTSSYVYWSTPVLQREIKVGDRAFIWRTQSQFGPNGIIAVGRVEEIPRQLNAATLSLFAQRTRVPAVGWNEANAPSPWKTGIHIDQVFWNAPLHVSFTAAQGTLRRLNDGEMREAEARISHC